MISRSRDIQMALRSRQRGFLLNPFLYGSSGPSDDPHWDDVGLLMHFDGTDGSTTFVDQKGASFNKFGSPVISTAQSKFGGASGLFPTAVSALVTPDLPGVELSSGDFTIECFVLFSAQPESNNIFINKGSGYFTYRLTTSSGRINAACADSGLGFPVNIIGATALSAGVWYHIAFTRQGASFRLFVNGAQDGAATYSGNLFNPGQGVSVGGAGYNTGYSPLGHMDELRITKGVARYTANFMPPTAPFPNS